MREWEHVVGQEWVSVLEIPFQISIMKSENGSNIVHYNACLPLALINILCFKFFSMAPVDGKNICF